jgi:hypothetical protein
MMGDGKAANKDSKALFTPRDKDLSASATNLSTIRSFSVKAKKRIPYVTIIYLKRMIFFIDLADVRINLNNPSMKRNAKICDVQLV